MRKMTISSPLPLSKVAVNDLFWSSYISLVRDVVVPYQWEALNDRIEGSEPSHAIKNFKIAAGMEDGEFYGMVFQDSDVAKWLEAVSYLLELAPNNEWESIADEIIDIIAKAQHKDGYLNTYFTLKEPGGRWSNLAECHELYCAGHLIEAAAAYFAATGKRKLLDVACRLADCIDEAFGPEDGKIKGYDGHPEIELALFKLYRATNDERYLRLAKFFIDERGQLPHFYDTEYEKRNGRTHFPMLSMAKDKSYSQAHQPVRLQQTAEGHAVRAVYLLSGMADVAAETGDASLWAACQALWRNIVSKRMYITGSIGSMAYGESFTLDYDLPSDTAYAETCASIGIIFFASRMLLAEPKSEYADVLERALYNTVLSGMSLDGKHFFYVNPLEIWPEGTSKNRSFEHVKPQRQRWFGCACCPPNIARLLSSLGSYIYSTKGNTIFTHLYIGSEMSLSLEGKPIQLSQHSELPWEGAVRFELELAEPVSFTLALRLPDWCASANVRINGEPFLINEANVKDGYVYIDRHWSSSDIVELNLPMSVNRMKGHPLIRETAGMIALQRGPLVYCLEEADNDDRLHQLLLSSDSEGSCHYEPEMLGGMQMIEMPAYRISNQNWGDELYQPGAKEELTAATARFIPYFAWANRGIGEMRVWVREHSH